MRSRLGELDCKTVGGELLGNRGAVVRITLDHEDPGAIAHHSSTSRGLTPKPRRAISASTSL
jgi:hypothetical protein